jgi:glycine/D-amino acid oxidase-like deaminating enzyme
LAHFLAAAGARIGLFESRQVGRGSTAASTALLMQEPDTDFGGLAARYGRTAARHIWLSGHRAVADMRQTLRALHIDARSHELASVYFTREPQQVASLRTEHRRRRAAGLAARWLDSTAVRALTGIEASGGILTRGNAQADPFRTCIGLARAARHAGAMIYEQSPVRRMRGDSRGVTLEVGAHRIRADWGIVATGYATPEFKPLGSRFRKVSTYVIATPRLSARDRRALGLGDVMLWDTGQPYHYLRWTPDRRLLFGGGDRQPPTARARASALERKVSELVKDLSGLYPSLAHVSPEFAWEGLFATTPDGLPYIGEHRRYPRHLFALGYGGNGMTFSFLAARLLSRIIEGRPRPEDALFSFGRGR